MQLDGFLIYLMLKLILTFNKIFTSLCMNKSSSAVWSVNLINPGNFAKTDVLQVEFWGAFREHSLMRIYPTQESGQTSQQ